MFSNATVTTLQVDGSQHSEVQNQQRSRVGHKLTHFLAQNKENSLVDIRGNRDSI